MASERRFVSKATFSFKRYTNNIPIINFYGWIIIILICQCVACVYPFSFTSRNLTLSLTFVFYDPSIIEEWLFGNNCYINCTRHSSYMFIFFACIERGSFCLEILQLSLLIILLGFIYNVLLGFRYLCAIEGNIFCYRLGDFDLFTPKADYFESEFSS